MAARRSSSAPAVGPAGRVVAPVVGFFRYLAGPMAVYLPFVVLGAAALWLVYGVFFARLSYPLDLEWMEGGTLVHALRLSEGRGLYVPPSVEFVSFLYTPIHPVLLAGLGRVFGLGYALGRAVSIAAFSGALAALFFVAAGSSRAFEDPDSSARPRVVAAGFLAAGAVAVSFPFCGAWFDLVRNDSLWLALVSWGLVCLARPRAGAARVVLGAVLLSAGFFTKQTAAPFLAAAAVGTLLVSGWRHALLFVGVAGLLTVGGVLLAQQLTDGWFWVYVYRLHQGHQTDWMKVWKLTPLRLIHHSAPLWVAAIGCAAVAVSFRRASKVLVFWTLAGLCGLVTSALGSATQGAYENAYIPGVYFAAALAAVASVELPALAARAPARSIGGPHRWTWGRDRGRFRQGVCRAAGLCVLSLLAAQILIHWFRAAEHVPDPTLRAQARRFLSQIQRLGPEVFVPYHPYYNVLAGGKGHLHIMGVNDVHDWARKITGNPERDRRIKSAFRRSVREAFAKRRWTAVIHDRTYTHQLFGLRRHYRLDGDLLREDASPRMLTGNPCSPRYVWGPR